MSVSLGLIGMVREPAEGDCQVRARDDVCIFIGCFLRFFSDDGARKLPGDPIEITPLLPEIAYSRDPERLDPRVSA
jgi:hypothetical protein